LPLVVATLLRLHFSFKYSLDIFFKSVMLQNGRQSDFLKRPRCSFLWKKFRLMDLEKLIKKADTLIESSSLIIGLSSKGLLY
jgi:hypothetical protein